MATITDKKINEIAELFSIFGDYTRCRIISKLFESPKKVSELAKELNMTTSAISHSIKTLKQAKIVKGERKGKEILYRLEDEHIFNIFEMAKEHIEE